MIVLFLETHFPEYVCKHVGRDDASWSTHTKEIEQPVLALKELCLVITIYQHTKWHRSSYKAANLQVQANLLQPN